MMPMRRWTSVATIEAAPRAAGPFRCAAAVPGSTASSSARRYRIAKALGGGPKANAPDRGGLRSGALALLCRSRLAPLELGFGPGLVLRGLTLRLGPRLIARGRRLASRLTARGRSLAPRLGARGRRVSAPALFRGRSALRLHKGPRGPVQTTGLVPVIGLVRPVAMIGLVGPVGPVAMIALARPVPLIGLVGPTAAAAVVSLIFGARPTPGWLNVGWRDDACATEVTTTHAHVAPPIVVHGPLAHPRDEYVGRLAVLEDEPGLGSVRAREDYPRAAVVPIRVIVRIIEHHDPKAHAGVIVGAPVRVTHVAVAIVAQEPGIVVMLLHVVRRNIVIPITVTIGHDALRQVGESDVRIAPDPSVGDQPIIPVVPALDAVVHERVGRGHGEQVADTRIVIDVEGVAVVSALHLVVATTAGEVVLPRLARKQHAHPAVGVDAQDRHEGIPIGAEVSADALAAGVGAVAPVGPDLDAGAIVHRHRPDRRAADRCGDEAEQPNRVQHGASVRAVRGQVACQPEPRSQSR